MPLISLMPYLSQCLFFYFSHVHYQKFVATVGGGKADLSAQKGLLIPMLSLRWHNRIEFTLQPFGEDDDGCRALTHLELYQPNRIIANSYNFINFRSRP